ncbi:MAG TPA: 4-alpha-glucanotransferase [Anaerolineales bacterium]|jgi:4-alpha-glucanotransferase|nr:4-alpha-glucanotransferase [Anaerolineales bacterium]
MKFSRSSGILLHPTSLPGSYGIGDIGPQAHRWIDFLADTGCRLWQVLPLGPTGFGDSPYQCFSAFAGNPYLVSPEGLVEDGLLSQAEIADRPDFPAEDVDYGAVIPWKLEILDKAYAHFSENASHEVRQAYRSFEEQQTHWLDDFSLFMALKEAHGGGPWVDWPVALRNRDAQALEQALKDHLGSVKRQIFRQFIFFRQWNALRNHAHKRDIKIIGDIPIFVAHDSAEVWARPELFYLDGDGNPTVVAGVPPDYFSETGQLWGNPLYRWEVHAAKNYAWWIDRFQAVLQLVDLVRLDHFRGFAGYWEVPAGEETAVKGRWMPGPGKHFFRVLQEAIGELPILAEDLGVITPDVVDMRDYFGLPGMIILQFAFYGDPAEPFLPHNHLKNRVVYTGTHDNDTTAGWFDRVSESERDFCRRYLGRDGQGIAWDMIRAAWSSVAVFAIAPLQDFLGLGNEARMNYPGNPRGNWSWRMSTGAIDQDLRERLSEFNRLYQRNSGL